MDTLETEVKACFMDKQVRKPSVRSKMQDLHLPDSEALLVEMTVGRPVWYLTVDHEMRPIRNAAVTAIVRSIEDLAKSAKEGSPNHTGHVTHEALTVWRSTFLELRNAPLNDLTSIIDEIDFDDDFKAVALFQGTLVTDLDLFHDEVLLVQVPEGDGERGDSVLPLLSDENLNLDYEKTYKEICNTKAPSALSKSGGYGKNQNVDRDIIYDGLYAPFKSAPDTVAPPVHIYHPIFWQFTRDANDRSLVPDPDFLLSVRDFMHGACKVSSDELDLNHELRRHLKKLLQWHMPMESNKKDTRSDGVIMFSNPDVRTPMVIAEFKRSLGEGGCDASIQAGNSMRKKLGEDESKAIVDKCCCPVFMLAGGGPWLCVLGGVFINRFIVQRLTDMMWIGLGTTHEDHRVYQVAKVLLALRNSLQDLNHFYEFVATTDKIPDFDAKKKDPHPRHFPYPHSYVGGDGTLVVFEYSGRLERDMRCVTYLAKIKGTGRMVVVKFVDRYGAEVHQFLAEKGHAPQLLYYGPLPEKTIYDSSELAPAYQRPMNGGYQGLGPAAAPEMKMVVMEYITPAKPHLDNLKKSRDKIAAVLEKLRSNGYVFGDLREPNVMFDANDEVKLIDFDWAGRYDIKDLSPAQQADIKKTWARLADTLKPTAEEQIEVDEQLDDFADTPFALYPISISPTLPWPDGAAPHFPILPAHDIKMLENLYQRWPVSSC
ncbi:hypothetical protein AGABI2DRAFT_191518 [Agaricus bisporus var. bisporus H97]|uniref:hypothetical protein n=1 Tax=Agaricus bisporus var. bisporus (strain H97 / ATCC MYA-4626 / FGSC 10389) TaxID=936046 RepID=UPI00029F6E04|nr:hypothetical protein AGABI2DRAFT_191518 [Agaricus bisporus var. bisporus H97]EKV49536.1 hypothetical protein AGABI2DRAFT_191518 [Agaricus bisporus var. bisporus H97]